MQRTNNTITAGDLLVDRLNLRYRPCKGIRPATPCGDRNSWEDIHDENRRRHALTLTLKPAPESREAEPPRPGVIIAVGMVLAIATGALMVSLLSL
jgi:hypothetical protein